MRRGNILNLKWANVDFGRGCIYVTKTKTDLDYSVPMNETVRETLQALRFVSKSEYVFTNPSTGKPWAEVKKAFEAARKGS
jgi:integrase